MIDLHTHSTASDGTMTPTELVHYAATKGITVMALTDHDTVAGLAEAKEAAKRENGLRLIPGIEISSTHRRHEVHILGLFIDPGAASIEAIMQRGKVSRDNRNEEIVRRFTDAGMPMTVEELKHGARDTTITRAHIARFLTEHGYTKTNKEAFEKYIGDGKPFYIERTREPSDSAIAGILAAGGIPVLAHPLLYHLPEHQLKEEIKELMDFGLKGLEVYYSCNVSNDEAFVYKLAKDNGLIMTGGSDFHGTNKPDIDIGTGKGWLKIPERILESLPLQEE